MIHRLILVLVHDSIHQQKALTVAWPSCDVAGSDPLLDRKRIAVDLVQSSEFNRLRHGQSIGSNGLELNRIVCDRLIYLGRLATVSMTVEDSFVCRAKTIGDPHFFFLISKKNVSGRFWYFLKKQFFFAETVWCSVNPGTCNWNTYRWLRGEVLILRSDTHPQLWISYSDTTTCKHFQESKHLFRSEVNASKPAYILNYIDLHV